MSTTSDAAEVIRFAGWEVWPTRRSLVVKGETVKVGGRAFDVLMALVRREGELATRQDFMDEVWAGGFVEDANLNVQMSTLRGFIGKDTIATVASKGYRLTAPRILEREGNLPAIRSKLLGRDDNVQEVAAHLANHRLVTLCGAGGIGKTRLAQAVGHAARARYAGGVWWVELAPLAHESTDRPASDDGGNPVAATVARTLGLTLAGVKSQRDQTLDAIRDAFRKAPMLIILDNCEHVARSVADFVHAALDRDGLNILATSQWHLKVPGEYAYGVRALSLPPGDRIEQLRAASATALLLERVQSLKQSFEVTETVARDVVKICKCLDGLPLAIELAAARVPSYGTAWVHDELDQLQYLPNLSAVAPDRQQTLVKTMNWSYELLEESERAIFRHAGVFAGGFSLATLQAVVADLKFGKWDIVKLLDSLVSKSLVKEQHGQAGRFTLLETARKFAFNLLSKKEELARAKELHASAMLVLFEPSIADRWNVATPERVATYSPDIENCRAALDWAKDGDPDLHVALAGASAWLWGATGQSKEGVALCDRALLDAARCSSDAHKARLLLGWCELAHYQRRSESSIVPVPPSN